MSRIFGTAVKEELYLGSLRGLLRRLGLGRARALLSATGSIGCCVRFYLRRRERILVRVQGLTAQFPVSSSREMRLIETIGGEKRVLRWLLQETRVGDVVYDIGSNFGAYTVFLSKAVGAGGQIIGFEPEWRSYRRCQENLRMNSLTNVRLFDVALGNKEGEVDLVIDERPRSDAHHVLRNPRESATSPIQRVQAVNGDRFIAEQALPIPNILKIDVEGVELEVLSGLSQTLCLPGCRLVCCEVHFAILDQIDRNDVPRRILELLEASGFKRVVWVDPSHLLAFKEVPQQRG